MLRSAPVIGGGRLRELRLHRQAKAGDPREWTQVAVARKIGAAAQTYRRWESGDRRPAPHNLIRLAELFEVSIEELEFGA